MINRATFAEKYALFQSEEDPGICCAVRLGLGAPEFIKQKWVYQEFINASAATSKCFNIDAARVEVSRNGYYIFMLSN